MSTIASVIILSYNKPTLFKKVFNMLLGLTAILTIITVLLFFRQFGSGKGERPHAFRGCLILGLSLAVITINTLNVSFKGGIPWNLNLITHTSLGMIYFVLLAATLVTGIVALKHSGIKKAHGIYAHFTIAFLLLSLLVSFTLIKFLR